jgi:hypothetical protein
MVSLIRNVYARWALIVLIVFLVSYFLVRHKILTAAHVIAPEFCAGVGVCVWTYFWWANAGTTYYFDAQDFVGYEGGAGRELPASAQNGTFAPLLEHYIGVSKLLITVAAASIAFGSASISAAKLILAFSILYGVAFCAAVLYRYDEYTQNVRSYTKFWYCFVETLGFSCLICFILGYLVWAFTT